MRLLHTETLQLTEFIGRERPHYAILSHTWGDEEILFQDVQGGRESLMTSNKTGLDKVLKAASVARRNGFDYIWIDTCCIDKSSSAELSEAINSMFAWYNQARVCYAYIADFDFTKAKAPSATNRWFTRGWTLQELIAPRRVHFYDSNWIRFGDRASLAKSLSGITGVDELALGWHLGLECPVRLETAIAARVTGQRSIPGEMTDFWSVQAMLNRCCDEAVSITDASALIHHSDGSCERRWVLLGQESERIQVKVTIRPVEFLGRQVMDILATVTPSLAIRTQCINIDKEARH